MKTIPDEVKEEGFYEPNQLGFEKKIKERMSALIIGSRSKRNLKRNLNRNL